MARLDGSSKEAVNSLLKVTEQPPKFAHFLFTASETPLLTIQSRAQYRARLPYLSDDEVAEILVMHGHDAGHVSELAKRSGGQVRRALEFVDLESPKAVVLSVLKAVADQNEQMLLKAVSKVDDQHLGLLRQWAFEAYTGQWRLFEAYEDFGVHKDLKKVRYILQSLRRQARPKVCVRAATLPLVAA
jgi:hypothetical protein